MRRTASRVIPGRIEESSPGVRRAPFERTKTFSPAPSETFPERSRRIDSSKPFSFASRVARRELRYCPQAFAWVGNIVWWRRVQEEIVTRTPFSTASGPR